MQMKTPWKTSAHLGHVMRVLVVLLLLAATVAATRTYDGAFNCTAWMGDDGIGGEIVGGSAVHIVRAAMVSIRSRALQGISLTSNARMFILNSPLQRRVADTILLGDAGMTLRCNEYVAVPGSSLPPTAHPDGTASLTDCDTCLRDGDCCGNNTDAAVYNPSTASCDCTCATDDHGPACFPLLMGVSALDASPHNAADVTISSSESVSSNLPLTPSASPALQDSPSVSAVSPTYSASPSVRSTHASRHRIAWRPCGVSRH